MTDWLLTLLYFLIFLFIIHRNKFFRPNEISFQFASAVFAAKVIAGILFGLIYFHYYKGEGDTFCYFIDGNRLNSFFFCHPSDYLKMLTGIGIDNIYFRETYFKRLVSWYNMPFDFFFNDSRILIRINSAIRFFSFGVYNVHVVFFSFISFTGLTALYRFFSAVIRENQKIFYAGIFLLPSVAFWGSGVIKEPVVIFSLGMLLWSILKLVGKRNFLNMFLVLSFAFLLILSKFYYLVALLPGIAAFLWSGNGKNILLKFAATHAAWFLLLYSVQFFIHDYDVALVISYKQNNFITMTESGKIGSAMAVEKLQPAWSDLLLKSPGAFLKVMFTPFNFTSGKIVMTLASIETLSILLLILLSLFFFRKPQAGQVTLVFFALSFIIITFTLIGLTTPVEGALVRYKVITLPFMIFLILELTDISKIKKLFSLS
jgi:hypothetical protein